MSEYTPTTEEVRDAYIESYACTASWNGEELWGAEFDRWLAEHDREQREIGWEHATAAAREVVEGTIYERSMIALALESHYRKG